MVEGCIMSVLKKLWVLLVDICFVVYMIKLRFCFCVYFYIGNVLFIDIFDKLMVDWDFVFKWMFDKVVVILVFIFLFFIIFVVVIVVKYISKGLIIFK